jgi:voltage-gated potassium channel
MNPRPHRVGFGDICPSRKNTAYGKAFILFLSVFALGFFVGPVMDLASSWKHRVPGGILTVSSMTLLLGVLLFSTLEGLSTLEALYFSIIAGTTIGYGDFTPNTDLGKLAVSIYVVLAINVTGALLEPAKVYLTELCNESEGSKVDDSNKKED